MAMPEHQLRLWHRLAQRLREVRQHARSAADSRRAEADVDRTLASVVSANPTSVNVPYSTGVFHCGVLLAVPAVYVLDVFLLGTVADFLAKPVASLFGETVASTAPLLVPAAIVAFEMALGYGRLALHRKHLNGDLGRGPFVAMTVLCVVIAAALPFAGLLGFLPKASAMPKSALGWIDQLGPVLMAIPVSAVCHGFVLLGASFLHDATTWLFVSRRCKSLRKDKEEKRKAFASESTAAADLWVLYINDLDAYNARYGPSLPVGPIDRNTRAVINEVFGYEAIRTDAPPTTGQPIASDPDRRGPTPSAEQSAAQTRRDTTAYDEPDWEALCALQQRDDESEVRA
jgi:hypothetical protein